MLGAACRGKRPCRADDRSCHACASREGRAQNQQGRATMRSAAQRSRNGVPAAQQARRTRTGPTRHCVAPGSTTAAPFALSLPLSLTCGRGRACARGRAPPRACGSRARSRRRRCTRARARHARAPRGRGRGRACGSRACSPGPCGHGRGGGHGRGSVSGSARAQGSRSAAGAGGGGAGGVVLAAGYTQRRGVGQEHCVCCCCCCVLPVAHCPARQAVRSQRRSTPGGIQLSLVALRLVYEEGEAAQQAFTRASLPAMPPSKPRPPPRAAPVSTPSHKTHPLPPPCPRVPAVLTSFSALARS